MRVSSSPSSNAVIVNPVDSLIDLSPHDLETVQAILRRHVPDREVLAFGSRVTWTAKESSDLDLAILGDEPVPANVQAALKEDFDESDLPFKVDLVDWATISESFRKIVERDKVVVQVGLKSLSTVGDGWSSTTIGGLLARDGGNVKTGPFGTTLKAKEYSKEGVPLISVGEVGHGSLRIHESTPRVPRGVVERLPEYLLQAGDIVFGRKGAVDRSAMVKPDQAGWFLGSDGIRLRLPNTCEARFVAYQLQSAEARSWLLQHASGTTMASLNQGTIERMPIVLPPLNEQRAIAHVLGSIDDKIEQNRRTVQGLERLAKAIFHAWFVDFEPVKAKAAGAKFFPSMPQEAFDTLPSDFANSLLGPVPRGWEVRPLITVASFLNGLALQKYPPRGDATDLPVIKIAELRRGSTSGSDLANGGVPETYIINDGDLLFSWSGTLEAELWFGGRGALNQHLFKVTSSHYPKWLCLLWIHQHLPWFRMVAASKAVTMGHIKRSHLQDALVVIPPPAFIEAGNHAIGSLFDLYAATEIESRSLMRMRDFLLPKLLSGAVSVMPSEQ
ncbi:MAG: restriction modification system specificity domain protein [Nevskia sp.]|nr:restriction modification system specificity domain protein [Nevskia sp.]